MSGPRHVWVLVALASFAAAGCAGRPGAGSPGAAGSGSAGTGAGSGGGTTGSAGTGGGIAPPKVAGLHVFEAECAQSPITVGGSPVRRISRVEYNHMVRDLGLDPGNTQPANQFVAEEKIDTGKAGNFNTNSYARISGTLINQQYLQAAEALASAAVTSNLGGLVGCGTRDAACAQTFITSFAGRAFRGQLDADASAALLALYNTVSAQFDFATGIQAVVVSVLTSPRFLFVLEFGQPDATGTAPGHVRRRGGAGDPHARRPEGQGRARRLREPVARHREHGRRHQGHPVHEVDPRRRA
jgi:hypothetical protein